MPRKRHLTPGSSPSAGEHSNSCLASQGELLQRDNHEPLQPPPTHSTCLTYPQASQISQRASRPSSQTSWQCPRLILQQSGEGHDLKILNFHFMDNAQRVRQCSKCPGDTEYCCVSCPCDLCHQCKENHVKDLKTIDHNVVKYREKYNNNPNYEISVSHIHSSHTTGQMDISSFNIRGETKQEIQRQVIYHIKNNRLFYMPFLLNGIEADVKICHTKFSDLQSQMLRKAEKLKNRIDCDLRDVDYKHECLKQKIHKRLSSILTYELKNEHSAKSPLKYLTFIKKLKKSPFLINDLNTRQLSMTESLNKGDVMDSLLKIQIKERRKRCTEIECLLKQMSGPELQQAYTRKQQQHIRTIYTIKNEAWIQRPGFLKGIYAEIRHTKVSYFHTKMIIKAQKLRHLIDYVLYYLWNNVFCDFVFNHKCLKQKIEMNRHIVSLQRYEQRYVQPTFTFSALQFLSFIKTALPHIHLAHHTSQLSMTESLNKKDVMESLSAIQITESGNRRVGNEFPLKLMSCAEIHQSLTVKGVHCCLHISCVTSDRVWVSDDSYNVILTDLTGVPLHRVGDSCSNLYDVGLHTVNSESELIYIDRNYNINKLSKDMTTTTTFIERTLSTWTPRCLHWSLSTGDLLVGMYNHNTGQGKVARYKQTGELIQTIQHDNTEMNLYSEPHYITENNNRDVVVSYHDFISESGAVVVTERGGRHRFSYMGPPSGSKILPCGICTDALSHILVCDDRTNTVQMIDRDGQFLSHLLIRPSGIFTPYSLSYEIRTHCLWVGSKSHNRVVVYSYLDLQDAVTDLNQTTTDIFETLNAIQTRETEKQQHENQCLLKLMSSPELLPSLTVTGVDDCLHISCVTSDRVWVSDDGYNLILTDTTGVPLHCVEDSCSGDRLGNGGLHTVNSESELIYIDRKYNINKLSKDMKTTTTFIERAESTWEPRCVFWSPSTGDLLVGMYTDDTDTGKVTRYNQSGQLTHQIQHDNAGLELYSKPNYLTENNNGDVVVSDSSAVVVTERRGRLRFTYTGFPSGSELEPCGICTDPLSHILVCDGKTDTVHMLDRDGQFLAYLLTKSLEMRGPWSLSYDVNTHRLWVGSYINNTVCVYRYITGQDALTDEHRPRPDGDLMFSSTSAVEWR